jgi:hypothetical protein
LKKITSPNKERQISKDHATGVAEEKEN